MHVVPTLRTLRGPARAAGRRASPLRLVAEAHARYLTGVALLIALYYGAAHVGYEFNFAGPVAAIVWLPVGVAIAFLYIGGVRFWPGVIIGDLLVNDYSALPIGSALGQSLGNLLEVLVAVEVIRRLNRDESPLDSVRGLGVMVVGIAAGTALSATIGSLSLLLGDVIGSGALARVWRTWWLGDASGALVVVPFALAWSEPRWRALSRARVLEAALALGAVAGLSALGLATRRPLAYLVFPALFWMALRFRQRGATLAIAIATGFALWGTTHYVGPFVYHSITRSILETQLFIAVAALSTLSLATVVSEREQFAERLRASRVRLVEAADGERRRIERNLHDGAQQRLTALLVQLGLAGERAREAPAEAPALFDSAEVELGLAIDELREFAHGIHPSVLSDFGLAKAMAALSERSTIPVVIAELPSRRVDRAAEATAYYVLAEAVTNAQKHAHAGSIRLHASTAPHSLRVEIADDGVGGATEAAGSGLQGLRDRAEALGGTFTLDSPLSGGTRVLATIPLAADADNR